MTIPDDIEEAQAAVPEFDGEPKIEGAAQPVPPPTILTEEIHFPAGMPIIDAPNRPFYWLCRNDLVYGHPIVVGEIRGNAREPGNTLDHLTEWAKKCTFHESDKFISEVTCGGLFFMQMLLIIFRKIKTYLIQKQFSNRTTQKSTSTKKPFSNIIASNPTKIIKNYYFTKK